MVTDTGDIGQRADYLMHALIDIVNRIASLRLDKALLAALLLWWGLVLIGLCLVVLVITVKVCRRGGRYLTTPVGTGDIPAADGEASPASDVPPAGGRTGFAMGGGTA